MKTDTRKHWYGRLGIGATTVTIATIAAGVAIYSAGPATADCSTLHIRDDAQMLDANAMQNAANVCPKTPALAWTTNKDAGNESAFTNDVKALVGPTYPMVVGHNALSNYTTVQIDPSAARITRDQADAAASYASTMFDNTYTGSRSNSTTAMLAAVRSLNSSVAADHGQSGMVAPAPGNDNGMKLNNQVPPVAPPTVPSSNNGTSGWTIFWWIAIPLIALALLALLLWRFLIGRRRRTTAVRPTQSYTRPVTRTSTGVGDTATRTTTATTAADAAKARAVHRPATPTAPIPPVRADTTAVTPAMTREPVRDSRHGEDLVTYEVRETDGSRQEFHYVDPEGHGPTAGEWVDQRGVAETDNNQSWWRPGVKDTGER